MTPASKFWIVRAVERDISQSQISDSFDKAESLAKQEAANHPDIYSFVVMESVAAYRGTVTVSRVDAEPEVKAEEVKPERVREYKKAIPDCWPDDLLHTATGSESWATGKAPYRPQVGDVCLDQHRNITPVCIITNVPDGDSYYSAEYISGEPHDLFFEEMMTHEAEHRFKLLYRPPSADSEGEGATK